MIVVTGGAGFIGSAMVCALNEAGIDDILVVDHLGTSEKWKNLIGLRYTDYLDRQQFITSLEHGDFGDAIDKIIHLGACSSTTERDTDYLMENNYRYSVRIGEWWEQHQSTRFMYASSAATYGDGAQGYADDHSLLHTLRPLNMYGYSKHLFDLFALRRGWLDKIVGIKFFNVFGPNEYHKGDMRSVINKAFTDVRDRNTIALFKSYKDGYGDGEQLRDFIYVKDAVRKTLILIDKREVGGIFNVGTGAARSWNDVAKALFAALGKDPVINYVEMPEHLRGKYQYFTEADCTKITRAGCTHECMTLEAAIYDYAVNYLEGGIHLEPSAAK